MEQLGEIYDSLDDIKKHYDNKYPDMNKSWMEIVNTLGSGLVNEIKDQLKTEHDFLKQFLGFKFRIVVDNNFVLAQIMGTLRKKGKIEDSFLYHLLLSKSAQIFAPPKLREELISKVHSNISEKDREVALKYASLLTSKISIQDAQWSQDWKKAKQKIGNTDEDDVPYLALAFDIESHGIISNDKVFQLQDDCKVWSYKDAGRIITSYHSGVMAFTLAGSILELLGYLASVIFKIIRDIILDFLAVLKLVANGVINSISKIPPQLLWIMAGLGIVAALSSEDFRKKGQDFLEKIDETISTAIVRIKELITSILEYLNKFIDVVEPVASPTFEFLGFLMVHFIDMQKELDNFKQPYSEKKKS